MIGTVKKISVIALIFTMLFSFIPADQIEVHAAGDRVATLSNSDHTAEIYYYNFSHLVNDLKSDYEGKVKAIKKGTCRIYVFAQSGIVKTVTVRIK